MTDSNNTLTQLKNAGVIAVIRAHSDEGLLEGAHALAQAGITALEITLNTPNALQWLLRLRQELSGVAVGAGTILNPQDAQNAMDAGAQFIVTPTLQPDSIALCRGQKVPVFCGAFTPTEALTAHQAGADFVKIFPATALGPTYIRNILAPLPFLQLVPTGGVTAENSADFLRAGAVAVGAGALFDRHLVASGEFDQLEKQAREWLANIAGARHE